LNWVPNLYFATDLAPNVKAGLGINAPFGLKTKYPSDWIGRYQAIDSVVESININPAIAGKCATTYRSEVDSTFSTSRRR
jgi:long-chain fatty acid transport protein